MFGVSFLGVLAVTIVVYLWFTISASNWRISIRREMNQSDNDANSKAIDSLLNYETVKYFTNEDLESESASMPRWRNTNARQSASGPRSASSISARR